MIAAVGRGEIGERGGPEVLQDLGRGAAAQKIGSKANTAEEYA